jgi:hypothetical protein
LRVGPNGGGGEDRFRIEIQDKENADAIVLHCPARAPPDESRTWQLSCMSTNKMKRRQ